MTKQILVDVVILNLNHLENFLLIFINFLLRIICSQVTPSFFPHMTVVELNLISLVLTFKRVTILRGFNKSSTGSSIFIPQNISPVATRLPRLPSECSILLIKNENFKGELSTFRVRRHSVEKALNWLKKNNPLYSNILIDPLVLDIAIKRYPYGYYS